MADQRSVWPSTYSGRCMLSSSRGGSDLHLKVPSQPLDPAAGRARRRSRGPSPSRPADTERVLREMLTASERLARVRARRRDRLLVHGAGPRPLPRERLPPARLDLDRLPRRAVRDPRRRGARPARGRHAGSPSEPRGIILVTGTTGSGKSTTLAAMVDHINRNYRARTSSRSRTRSSTCTATRRSVVHQREIGFDTSSFSQALRRVLRQDPDVILIGEMRDEETVGDRAERRRDRAPRAQHAAHDRRRRDRQPHHRLLPAAPPPAGARDARRRRCGA